jgi:hypothetical protein
VQKTNGQITKTHYKLKIKIALIPEASAAAPSTRARTKAGRSVPHLLPGVPGEGGLGGDGQGDGRVPRRGRSGKEEEGPIRDWATQQHGHPEGQEDPSSLHSGTGSEEVEDILHAARKASTMGGGCKTKAMMANLDEKDVAEEGEHDVRKRVWKGRGGQAAPDQPLGEFRQAGLNLGGRQRSSELLIDEL